MTALTKEFFEQGLGKLEKNLKVHIETQTEQLARMVSGGFNDVMDRFGKVDNRLDGIDNRLDGIDNRLEVLEQGQENIELRLVSLSPKFEVKELQKQMEKVEKRVGI